MLQSPRLRPLRDLRSCVNTIHVSLGSVRGAPLRFSNQLRDPYRFFAHERQNRLLFLYGCTSTYFVTFIHRGVRRPTVAETRQALSAGIHLFPQSIAQYAALLPKSLLGAYWLPPLDRWRLAL